MIQYETKKENDKVHIGGLAIDCLSRKDLAQRFLVDWQNNHMRDRIPVFSTSANGHVLALANHNLKFRALLDHADHIDADGMPLVIASHYLAHRPLPERIATTDFIHDLARLSHQSPIRFFLLGATKDENRRAIDTLKSQYPNLLIAGHHGFWDDSQEELVIEKINEFKTDLLWVGLGIPREHEFALRHRQSLRGVTWIKTCGGLFNFLSGSRKRAPIFLQNIGMEWAWRMLQEPGRLGPRYLKTNGEALRLIWRHRRQ